MPKKQHTKKIKLKKKNSLKYNKKVKKLKSIKVGKASINNILNLKRNKSSKNLNNNIDILNKKLVSETKFGGYPLDLLFGIIYLKKKHPTMITLPFDVKELLQIHADDLRERTPFTFIGCIIFKCQDKLINSNSNKNTKLDVKNFEIEYPAKVSKRDFYKIILNAKQSGKRFTIIPLIIRWTCEYEFDGHANIIIFDFEKNIVERFEPYGYISSFTPDENKVSKEFNKRMKKIVESFGLGLKYEDPYNSIEKGPQFLEENEAKIKDLFYKISDPEGFCGAWSLWYADLRLSNPTLTPSKLAEKAISTLIDKRDISMREFIRNYSVFLVKERYKFLRDIGQKNPYNYKLGDQLLSLEDKKSTIASALKTVKLIKNKK